MVVVTKAPAVKAALVGTILPALYAPLTRPVFVNYGFRVSAPTWDDVVAVGNVETAVNPPTLGRTPSRSQHERMTVSIRVACYRAGADQQQAASESAWELYDLLSEYLRVGPGETFGVGSRVEGRMVSHDLDEDPPPDSLPDTWSADPDIRARGRYATLDVALQVDARLL